jgi:hypothetical protein
MTADPTHPLAPLVAFASISGLCETITEHLQSAIDDIANGNEHSAVTTLATIALSAEEVIEHARTMALAAGGDVADAERVGDMQLVGFLTGAPRRLDTEVAAELTSRAYERAVVDVAEVVAGNDKTRMHALVAAAVLANEARKDAGGDKELTEFVEQALSGTANVVAHRLEVVVQKAGERVASSAMTPEAREAVGLVVGGIMDYIRSPEGRSIASARSDARRLLAEMVDVPF